MLCRVAYRIFFPGEGNFRSRFYMCMLNTQHVKAAHKTLFFSIYMYMYAYYCISDPKILGGGGELKLGVGNPRPPAHSICNPACFGRSPLPHPGMLLACTQHQVCQFMSLYYIPFCCSLAVWKLVLTGPDNTPYEKGKSRRRLPVYS